MAEKAILVGASGLIGSHVLRILDRNPDYREIVLLVRTPLDVSSPKIRQIKVDFNRIKDYSDEINGHAVFSCLGTTRSQVSDYKEYRQIDFEYPLQIAGIASANGIGEFHIVTSLGADKNSSNSYLKLKGELEEALKRIPFKSLHIYRPSVITGERKKSRIADKILTPLMGVLNPLLMGTLRKYRSIPAGKVAAAMVEQASAKRPGIFIYESDHIQYIK